MSDESSILSGAPEATPAAEPAQNPKVAGLGLTPPAPPGPDLIDYPMGGRTYKVDREFIQALEGLSQQQQASQPAQEPPVAAPEDDLDTLWYTQPRRAAEMVRRQAVQEVTQLYQREQFWGKFWGDFTSQNPDLVPARGLAEMILNSRMNEFAPLSPEAGLKRIADLTREQLTAATVNLRANVPAPLPVLAEGASQRTRDVTDFSDAAGGRKIESLSEAIRARRESRRAANTKPSAE